MNRTSPLVCLVTPGHIGSAPRLVKEADALSEAGYRVHVVSGRYFEPAGALDAAILARVRWRHTAVDYSAGLPIVRKALREIARRLAGWTGEPGLRAAARAQHAEVFRLAAAAARTGADFFLGHGLAGLCAAAFAAQERGVQFGFDIEDLHDAETESGATPGAAARTRVLQASLLPRCRHLTASSPLIAEEYRMRYDAEATVVLNVFPLAEAPALPSESPPIGAQRPARLYWFSQTVGPGRGLEQIVRALGLMRTPAELHLRGFVAPNYAALLQDLAKRLGVIHPIVFLPPGPPDAMVPMAAGADLGLSVEETLPLNRDLCLTNKIFAYLLAGIPQLLSDTRAQRALAQDLGEAALLADIHQAPQLAALLDGLFGDPQRLQSMRRAAWDIARNRYCWDLEKEKFLASLRAVVGAAR